MDNHDDWDQHWSDYDLTARYNPAQAFRRELMVHWLQEQSPSRESRLLDIGSGQGDFVACLIRIFPDVAVAGVEMSGTGIAQSQVKAPTARFFQRDLQLNPDSGDGLLNWATLAVCSEVLEHVDDPGQVLANASKYLTAGARLFITVPGGPMSAFDRHIGHRKHFDTTSLRQVINAAGLIPENVRGAGFPFFNLYRTTVILRGKALIKDAYGEDDQKLSWMAKAAMKTFSIVLKRRFNAMSLGWQMTAIARKPL